MDPVNGVARQLNVVREDLPGPRAVGNGVIGGVTAVVSRVLQLYS